MFFLWILLAAIPRVSIITSVWNGDEFIEGFLADITRQTIFPECELILVNANSPGSEELTIQRYQKKYSNIVYRKLPYDPGLYGVWNYAIQMARAPLIANANLDDRNRVDALERQAEALEKDLNVDLVYAVWLYTRIPNETFEHNHFYSGANPPEFSPQRMFLCLPGPRPMWRKSMHEKYGYFSESFSSAGDYEMWVRAVSQGAKFKKIPGVLSLIYVNPQGLSTDLSPKKVRRRELELQLIERSYPELYAQWDFNLPPTAMPEGY